MSVSAVSKVLRDAYGVSPEMREKVNAAIEFLNYRPQSGARAMRGRSFTIGVLLTDIRSPFAPMIIEGIVGEFENSPFQVIMGAGGAAPELQQRSVEAMVDHQVDGLIMITPSMPSAWLDKLAENLPVVVIARHGRGKHYDTVVDEDAVGAALMVEHLVELGHREIVHISHPIGSLRRPSVLAHTARADGYAEAMAQHGLEADVITTSYTEEGGYQGAMKALRRTRPPTAIFAGADVAALGVLRAAHECGFRVPEDLTVTGYDNIDVSAIPQISLTTMDQSGQLSGSMSAKMLRERLDGRTAPTTYSITPRLIARRTSTSPRAD